MLEPAARRTGCPVPHGYHYGYHAVWDIVLCELHSELCSFRRTERRMRQLRVAPMRAMRSTTWK
jgi:hypothetical protein